MTGVEFKVRLEASLGASLRAIERERPAAMQLVKGMPTICQRSCTLDLPGAPLPVLDLLYVEIFLSTYEDSLNTLLRDEEFLQGKRVDVLCFHQAARSITEPSVICFYLHESLNTAPPPVSRVVCSVVNTNVYH